MNLHPNGPGGQEKKHEVTRDFLLNTARNRIKGMNETTFGALCARAVAHVERLNFTPKNDSKGYLALRPMAQAQLARYYADHVMPAEERDAALVPADDGVAKEQQVQVSVDPVVAGPVFARRWPATKWGIPSLFVRCALFAGVPKPRGRMVDENVVLVAQAGGMAIRRVSGAEWIQYDLSVLMLLVQIADATGRFEFGVDDLLRMLGITPAGNTRKALEQSLCRLAGRMSLDSTDGNRQHRRNTSALAEFTWSTRRNKGTGQKCFGELSKALMELYVSSNVTHIETTQRLALPAGLAQWLHAYYSSHREPIPVTVIDLAKWAGLTSSPKEAARLIREALMSMQSVGFLTAFTVAEGRVTVERSSR